MLVNKTLIRPGAIIEENYQTKRFDAYEAI